MKKPTVTVKGGDVTILCPHSQRYDRTGPSGMYCSKKDCACKKENDKAMESLGRLFNNLTGRNL